MSDNIEVVPVFGVEITFEEFCKIEFSVGGLAGFMAGVDEKSGKFRGYYLGKGLCEMAFPDEYSASFEMERIEETRDLVRTELKKRGIDQEPEFLLVEFIG